jgi:cell division topological specificity factor
MTGFFDRMLGRNNTNKGSSSTAKERLKFVLLHERVNIAPEKMREMKAEIAAVIARYVPGIDPETVDIAIEQSDRYDNKLIAEIPFTKSRGTPTVVDYDENDDLDIADDDMVEAAHAAELNPEFHFHKDDTVPNPALQDPNSDLDMDTVETATKADASDIDDDN